MLSDSNLVLLLAGFCIASYGLWLNAHALPRFLTAKRNLRKALFAASVIAFVLAAEYAVVVQLRSSKSAPDPATNQFVQYAQAYSQIEHESKTKRLGWEYGCRGTDVGLGAGKRLSWEEEVARDEDIAHKTLGTIFDHDRRWAGVHMDRCEMLRFMENVLAPFKPEWEVILRRWRSDMLGKQDALVLYAMIRGLRPARVIEIGSGDSTVVGATAATANAAEGHPTRYEIVEPFPSRVPANLEGLCRPDCIKQQFLEQVPLSHFLSLRRGDILFVDSSHLVGRHWDVLLGRRNNSRDVALEFTELIPRLQPGVIVHVHDIPFPSHLWFTNSTPGETPRLYTEQFMLQALLQHSELLHPLWFGGALHTPWHPRLGFSDTELAKTDQRAKRLFGKNWAGGDPLRPFGGGGSVWMIRTETTRPPHRAPWACSASNKTRCGGRELPAVPASATLGEVLDKHRAWVGVELPEEEWPAAASVREAVLGEVKGGAGEREVCRVLQGLRAEAEARSAEAEARSASAEAAPAAEGAAQGTPVLEIGGGAGRLAAGRWGKCGAGGHRVMGETRAVVLADILGLPPGAVLVYVRGSEEVRGRPESDGFLVFVTEALPRVPPGVVVVVLGVPFPRHAAFEASAEADTDDTQFFLQAALIYNRRLKLLAVSPAAVVLRAL